LLSDDGGLAGKLPPVVAIWGQAQPLLENPGQSDATLERRMSGK